MKRAQLGQISDDDKAQRLQQKIQPLINLNVNQELKGWFLSRSVTTEGMVLLKEGDKFLFAKHSNDERSDLSLYSSTLHSQVVSGVLDRPASCSVTTNATSLNIRSDEEHTTFVQYDKNAMDTADKDFLPRVNRYTVPRAFYEGGHLVDYKFSVGDSHTSTVNYIPEHYFYNSPIKEYLVQRSQNYVEILLFTSQPPKIKAIIGGRESDEFHEIPIGILFLQINNQQIQDAYYFPNNDYDYKSCIHASITSGFAERIVPLFKLKKAFHRLLIPACIIALTQDGVGEREQIEGEGIRALTVLDISTGMSFTECQADEEVIYKVSSEVIHKREVCIGDFLEMTGATLSESLQYAFNTLGDFIVNYAFQNAIKSEYLSTQSRLIFSNIIVDFITNPDEVSEEALDFVDQKMGKPFKQSLTEFNEIVGSMTMQELLYFAHVYNQLTDPQTHPIHLQGYSLYNFQDIEIYSRSFIRVLMWLANKAVATYIPPGSSCFLNLVELFISAQTALSSIAVTEEIAEEYLEEREFLKNVKPQVEQWLALYQSAGEKIGVNDTYSTGIERTQSVRSGIGYLTAQISYLGTYSSILNNHEWDTDYSSDGDNEQDMDEDDFSTNAADMAPVAEATTSAPMNVTNSSETLFGSSQKNSSTTLSFEQTVSNSMN